MFLKAEFFARRGRVGLLISGVLLAAAMMAACTLSPAPRIVEEEAPQAMPEPAASAESCAAFAAASAPELPASAAPSCTSEALALVLAYADRVRAMPAAELGQEAARLGRPTFPAEQLQLALVLSQLHQTPELIRAQDLLTRLLANTTADAQTLHPLARLLAARYSEQRRLEDQLEKQNQQTRDVQRKLDQTNERLEALKAIERSLTSRTPASGASAPINRSRTPAP
jgi:septal ring factor EnvC (AmiA/AmiB activator)